MSRLVTKIGWLKERPESVCLGKDRVDRKMDAVCARVPNAGLTADQASR